MNRYYVDSRRWVEKSSIMEVFNNGEQADKKSALCVGRDGDDLLPVLFISDNGGPELLYLTNNYEEFCSWCKALSCEEIELFRFIETFYQDRFGFTINDE